jgi:hypothetical protein
MSARDSVSSLSARWMEEWPQALAAWSHYTQLRPPTFIEDQKDAAREGMLGEIAAIRLQDQRIAINVDTVHKRALEVHGHAIMAHEIGHHVYVPGNLTDNARMVAGIARMLTGLPTRLAHIVGNLYGDLLINDRLQRRAGVNVAAVYKKLAERESASNEVWKLYMRTYEHLWSLPAGALVRDAISAETDADAMLLARLIRNFAANWLPGARRFAAILFPYLAKDEANHSSPALAELGLHDTKSAGAPIPGDDPGGAIPDGLAGIDPSEVEEDDFEGDILDPLGERRQSVAPAINQAPTGQGTGRPGSQYREPFEYGQLMKSLGLNLSESDVTTHYYRERALPHLIPFPTRRATSVVEPLAEGYAPWEIGDPMGELDVLGSLLRSPVVFPGVTSVRRVYGETPGSDPQRVPLNLDIYIDSSGSMPHPSVDVSYLALAGTILPLSALRAGARVQATLWSGPGRFRTTQGFIRDEKTILGIVTGWLGGSTAFPLHVLRDTYESRPASRVTHVVVVSDEGADTMLQKDERGTPGADICSPALNKAGGGGTLVLNIWRKDWAAESALRALGFSVHRVTRWEDLIQFAREFVRRLYGEKK